jgi:hypothetical protein
MVGRFRPQIVLTDRRRPMFRSMRHASLRRAKSRLRRHPWYVERAVLVRGTPERLRPAFLSALANLYVTTSRRDAVPESRCSTAAVL